MPYAASDTLPLLMSDLIAESKPSDWRPLDPKNTLYLEFGSRRVIIELAPDFAPQHVANVRALARERYWDGLAMVRVDDNYIVQWADPHAENSELARTIRTARETLPAEFDCAIDPDLPFHRLPDNDVYAEVVGFTNGFPIARDEKDGRTWLVNTYGTVGSGRETDIHSGGGKELYSVIGHAPRQLDRNVTAFGRVRLGIEFLSALPRGNCQAGFYQDVDSMLTISSVRLASEVPLAQRTQLEILRTDTALFADIIESRRNRHDAWFYKPAGHIDIGNVPVPVRLVE